MKLRIRLAVWLGIFWWVGVVLAILSAASALLLGSYLGVMWPILYICMSSVARTYYKQWQEAAEDAARVHHMYHALLQQLARGGPMVVMELHSEPPPPEQQRTSELH